LHSQNTEQHVCDPTISGAKPVACTHCQRSGHALDECHKRRRVQYKPETIEMSIKQQYPTSKRMYITRYFVKAASMFLGYVTQTRISSNPQVYAPRGHDSPEPIQDSRICCSQAHGGRPCLHRLPPSRSMSLPSMIKDWD